MSTEDNKLDKFLKELITEAGLEKPPSSSYVDDVMLKISLAPKSIWQSKRFVVFVGLAIYALLGLGFYFASNENWLSNIEVDFFALYERISSFFSPARIALVVVGLLFYLVIVRALIVVFFMHKKQNVDFGIQQMR